MKEKIAKPKKFRQNTEVTEHFHPRRLARAVAHSRMKFAEMEQVNKVKPGTTKSAFSQKWRDVAASMTER